MSNILNIKISFFGFIFFNALLFNAQNSDSSHSDHTNIKRTKKNSLYTYWGWNRGFYSKSDIRFQGKTYDFTIYDVIANDRQSEFKFKTYLSLKRLTIPQYNFRLGYYLSDKVSISFGADHMKYVMKSYQIVKISGEISQTGTVYDKTYENENIELETDFLMFEHTDGLNYENLELRYHNDFFVRNKFNFSFFEGFGLGALIPRTNTTLLNNPRYDQFHLSGYGLNTVVGANFEFYRYFFIQFEAKFGFFHMPDIRTTVDKSDKASQHFFFSQFNGLFGFRFPLGKNENPFNKK
jgi:hypothetical protein